jgi:RHS repeat-associated protein/uncharacterized repeat protein (TIGR01451 family)
MGIRSLRTTAVAIAAVLVLVVGTAGQALACGTRERNENLRLETSVGSPTLSPSISLSLAVDRQIAIPGDKLTYSAVVTNTGSNLTLTGEIEASNSNRTAATIGAWYDVVSSDPKGRCGDCDQDSHGNDKDKWTPLAAAAGELAGHMPVQKAPTAPGMTFSAVPVPAKGVTYPTGTDTLSGTSIGPSATARWEFTAVVALTPAQAKALFKGSEALPIRQSFHAEPTSGIIADSNEATLVSVNFCRQLTMMNNSGSATSVSVAITLPDGTVRNLTKSTTAALASIVPGASATATASYTVPVPAAKGASETGAAYHARLAALDAKSLTASATAKVGTAGASVAAPAPATTTETVPILSLAKTGPATVDAGKSATYDLALSNNGSASAASLTLADSLPDGTVIPTGGTPAALAPAATGTAHASYTVPAAQPAGDLTDTASLRWTDANGNTYGPISSNATTKVTRPTVTVTVTVTASSGSITYGGTVPTITPSYSGWVGGDGPSVLTTAPVCTTTATSASGVGTYKTSCSGAIAPNYTFVYVDGTVSVKAAPVIVTASSGAMAYGGAPPAITPGYSGWVGADGPAVLTRAPACSTTATASSGVGTYKTSCSGAAAANYTFSYVDGSVTVNPALVTVTASSGSMPYGGTAPVIAPSYSGWANGQGPGVLTTAPVCSTVATSASPAGTYTSSCAGAAAPNYTFSYVDGSVTVIPALVTVTASSGSMTYGGTVPVITPSYSGWVGGDGPGVLTTAPVCTTTATSASPAGTYHSSCSGAAAPNYTFSYVDGTVSVNGVISTGLALSPQSSGPLPINSSHTFTVTATDLYGQPVAGAAVALTVDGPNAATTIITTGADGKATYSYTGVNAGTDYAQAVLAAQPSVASNTASVTWYVPIAAVTTDTVQVDFYTRTSWSLPSFQAQPGMTPVFSQDFPNLDFNPIPNLVPGNTTVDDWTRPYTDVVTNSAGFATGTIVAQGNGYQAGVGSLYAFDAVYSGNIAVEQAGDLTFNVMSDDGFVFGVGGGATRVSGVMINPPSTGATAFNGYPLMGALQIATAPRPNPVTVHFPAPGVYPYEIDHFEINGQDLSLVVQEQDQAVASTGTLTLSPSTNATVVRGSTQTYTVQFVDASGKPAANQQVWLNVTGANNLQPNGGSSRTDANGLVVFSFVGTNAGVDTVQASAALGGEMLVSNTATLTWVNNPGGGGGNPPSIGSIVPADGSVLTAPTPLTASINAPSGEAITDWTVSYQSSAPGSPSVPLASGSGTPPATLATIDPTLLANGEYTIIISAFASGGGGLSSAVDVVVSGNLKLGRYQVTYQDANVPVGGIPIQVQRTYDSFDKSQGAFGVGWQLGVANFRVYTDGPLGAGGWSQYATSCFLAGLGGGLCQMAWATSRPHFVTVVWPDGHTETFDFTPTGGSNLFWLGSAAFTARSGSTSKLQVSGDASLSYTGDGNLYGGIGGPVFNPTRFTLTARDGTVYLLDGASGLVSETDRNGNTVTVDAAGIHSSLGPSLTFTRDSTGRITKLTHPDGSTVLYGYNGAGDLVSVTDENGNVVTFSYDANHNMQVSKGPSGNPIRSVSYGADGRVSGVTDASGNTTQISSNVDGHQEVVTSPDHALTMVMSYDARGDLIQVDQVYGGTTHTTKFTYDDLGRITSNTDPLGHVTSATWDDAGNPLSLTEPDGTTLRFTYNDHDQPLSVSDGTGTVLDSFAYDANGNLLSATQAGGSKTTYAYDSLGVLGSITDPTGEVATLAYTSAGLVGSLTESDGRVWTYGYDAGGRLASYTDPTGATTKYAYDGAGDLVSFTDPLGNGRTYAYDYAGNVTSMADSLGHKTSYAYAGDLLASVTDRNGATTSYAYDAESRLTSVSLPDGTSMSYAYNPLGEPTEADNQNARVSFSYDAAGYLTSQTSRGTATSNQPTVSLTVGRDSTGRISSVQAPWGATNLSYDSRGFLSTLTDGNGGTFAFSYDVLGELSQLSRPNGVNDVFTYNPLGQLLSRTSSGAGNVVDSVAYTYDMSGQPTSRTDAAGTVSYGYDAATRLLSVTPSAGSTLPTETFTYDAAGNRTSGGATYDANDRLTSDANFTYLYDNEGNLITRTEKSNVHTTHYSWNALDQLISATLSDGTVVAYKYDALGRQIEASTPAGSSRYVYLGTNKVAEYDGSNTLLASYTVIPDLGGTPGTVLESTGQTTSTYPLLDAVGSVTAVTNAAGAAAARYEYSAFGAPVGASSGTYAFGTYAYDSETGLYDARARTYDPGTGRYLSEDPMASVNPYSYAVDDPIAHGDPSGAEATVEQGLLRSIAVGAATGAMLDVTTYQFTEPSKDLGGYVSHAVEGAVTGGLWGAGLGGISALSKAWALAPLEVVTLKVLLGLFMTCEALVVAGVEDEIQGKSMSSDQALYIMAVNIGTGGASKLPELAEGFGSQLIGTPADPGFWVGVGDSACKAAHLPFCS